VAAPADRQARTCSAGQPRRLTGRPGHTVPGVVVQTRFEIKSKFKWFKTFSNCFKFGSIRKYFPVIRKIELKYGFEALEEENNFLYRNFLRFRMDLE
jgi:hypothetical protein